MPGSTAIDDPESRGGLRRDLTQSELTLLRIVFGPFYGSKKVWPTWTYVSRKMYIETKQDAWVVWRGLPRIYIQDGFNKLIEYGPLWRSNSFIGEPLVDEKIGLTIAGLMALSDESSAAREFVDWAIEVGRSCAEYEIETPLDPEQSEVIYISSAHWHRPLGSFTGLTPGMPPECAWAMLRHEPIMPTVMDGITTPDEGVNSWKLRVLPSIRQLIDLKSPDDYLDLVEEESHRFSSGPAASPIDLIRALDFFAMAVAAAKNLAWSNSVIPRRLLPVARLMKGVSTSEDFSDRISALSNILNDINLPDIPSKDWKHEHPAGSVNRLEYWLVNRHDLDLKNEISILRAINKIRAHIQHPRADTDTLKHYRILGLEMPITNWSNSWDLLLAHATHSFQSIADVVLDLDVEESGETEVEAPVGRG